MNTSTSLRSQRGLSLVEMMVGIAVGLFIVAAATLLLSTQLGENRRLLLETQVQQDLRASADIIAREMRRSAYWPGAFDAVWSPTTGDAAQNPFDVLSVVSGGNGQVGYKYKRADQSDGPFGFKLDAGSGVIRTRLADPAGWQELTDRNVLFVESLTLTLNSSPIARLSCPKSCPLPIPPGGGADYCWPTYVVRDLTVAITGHAVNDATVRRTVQSRIRLRNDQLLLNAGPPGTPQACPA